MNNAGSNLPLANRARAQYDPEQYKHSALTERIIAGFYETYNELGYGFLESVYAAALVRVLRSYGLLVEEQVAVPVWFRKEKIGEFYADLIINRLAILELKAVRALDASHEAQLLNYLRETPIEVGLLLNFGPKPAVRRMAFSNDRKEISVTQR